jgi:tetratricopeptide (TPR) repeat protein
MKKTFFLGFILFCVILNATYIDDYRKAEKALKRGYYKKAVKFFEKAIDKNSVDKPRVRSYGNHYIQYFPHRELGIALYQLGDMDRARDELKRSIRQYSTSRAKSYLEKVENQLYSEKQKVIKSSDYTNIALYAGIEITNEYVVITYKVHPNEVYQFLPLVRQIEQYKREENKELLKIRKQLAPITINESALEYDKRIKLAEIKKKDIEAKYALKIQQEENKVFALREKVIRDSEKNYEFEIDEISQFLDESYFFVSVNEINGKVFMNQMAAYDLIRNENKLYASAKGQYSSDMQEILYHDYKLIHPTNKLQYSIVDNISGSSQNLIFVTAKVEDSNSNRILERNEVFNIVCQVRNVSTRPATGLVIRLQTEDKFNYALTDTTIFIQKLLPNEIDTVSFSLNSSKIMTKSIIPLIISADDASGLSSNPQKLFVETVGGREMNIELVGKGSIDIDSKVNYIKYDKPTEFFIKLKNNSLEDWSNLEIIIQPSNEFYVENYQNLSLPIDNIYAGSEKIISFIAIPKKTLKQRVRFSLSLKSATTHNELALQFPLSIPYSIDNITRDEIIENSNILQDIRINIPITRKRNPNGLAILIGNRDYNLTKNVDYALNDVDIMQKYLIQALGYNEENVFVVENANKAEMEKIFGNESTHNGLLANLAKSGDKDIFVYYSGHGAPGITNKKGYFLPVDCDPHYVAIMGYSADLLYGNLAKIVANSLTVVVDACFSGEEIFDNVSFISIKVTNPIVTKGLIFSASQSDQPAVWYNEKEMGLFTYYFLKSIHNLNADKDRDGKITAQEIIDFTQNNVAIKAAALHNIQQSPTLTGSNKNRIIFSK